MALDPKTLEALKDGTFDFEGHLKAKSTKHQVFDQYFTAPKAPAQDTHKDKIDPNYLKTEASQLKLSHPDLDESMKFIRAEEEAAKVPNYKLTDDIQANLETHGKIAQSALDRTERTIAEAKADLGKEVDVLNQQLQESVRAGHIKGDEAKELSKTITEHAKAVEGKYGQAQTVIEKHRAEVLKDTKVPSKAKEFVAPKGSVLNAIESAGAKMSGHVYDNQKLHQKVVTDVKANWNKGKMGKIQTTVGAIGVLDGIRRTLKGLGGMFSGKGPENENQAGAGTLIVGLAEIGGATLLARAGGRAAATGMSK